MKRLGAAWSPVLVVLIACGGSKAGQPSDATDGGGPDGREPAQQADGGQDGTGGSLVMDASAMLNDGSSGGADAGSGSGGASGSADAGSANAGSGGSGGASGSAGDGTDGGDGVDGGDGGVAGQDGRRSSDAGDASSKYITPEALIPVANAFCATARTCCMRDGIRPLLDECESWYAYGSTPQALRKGTITVDSAGLASCLAAYQTAAETCEASAVIAACRGVVHGTLAEGQPCTFDSECVGIEPMVCLRPDEQGAGVCKKIVHAKAGDACFVHCRPDGTCAQGTYAPASAPANGCFEAEGVYCDRTSNSPKCESVHATGATCTDSEQCGSALSECDVPTRKCKVLTVDAPRRFSAGGVCGGASYGP